MSAVVKGLVNVVTGFVCPSQMNQEEEDQFLCRILPFLVSLVWISMPSLGAGWRPLDQIQQTSDSSDCPTSSTEHDRLLHL